VSPKTVRQQPLSNATKDRSRQFKKQSSGIAVMDEGMKTNLTGGPGTKPGMGETGDVRESSAKLRREETGIAVPA
jgi:hypothetical protein